MIISPVEQKFHYATRNDSSDRVPKVFRIGKLLIPLRDLEQKRHAD
jgi:hypothetical protein